MSRACSETATLEQEPERIPKQHQFWTKDEEVRKVRIATLKQTLMGLLMITITLWIVFPFFWGSTWLLLRYFHQLTVAVVDFETPLLGDAALMGPAVVQMASETNVKTMQPHLGFDVLSASQFPAGPEQVMDHVGYSKHWGAMVVYPNCTSTWISSLQNGNTSYDPTGCIGVFYSGARFYQITLLYLAPFLAESAQMTAQMVSKQAVSNYLQQNAGNATALALAAQVPQAIGTGMSYFNYDVRPVNAWAVAAIFEAALIYFMIFAYHLAVWGYAGRAATQWNKKLTFPSLLLWRLGVPTFFYFWMSLVFTTIAAAFQIPMNAAVGQAGFVVLWALNFTTLLALGLALESLISILTPKFLPFALIAWIILNITSSFTPIELTEKFYNFLRWVPFHWTVNGYKVITYAVWPNWKLGEAFGILLAVAAVNVCSMCLFVALERRKEEKAERESLKQEESEKKER